MTGLPYEIRCCLVYQWLKNILGVFGDRSFILRFISLVYIRGPTHELLKQKVGWTHNLIILIKSHPLYIRCALFGILIRWICNPCLHIRSTCRSLYILHVFLLYIATKLQSIFLSYIMCLSICFHVFYKPSKEFEAPSSCTCSTKLLKA